MSVVDGHDDSESLMRLDADGFVVLDAIGPPPRSQEPDPNEETSPGTHSRPRAFVCIDGHIYWCKSNFRGGSVQQGLIAELVAGRLAATLGVGAPSAIVRVTNEAIAGKPGYEHLEGIVFGCRQHDGMVHVNKLAALLGNEPLKDGQLDLFSWARVVAFQSWIGLSDGAQMMIDLTNGRVVTLDHGDCFSNLDPTRPSVVINGSLPGKPPSLLQDWRFFEEPVGSIERVTDRDLLRAVSRIPIHEGWNSPVERRLAIRTWLASRRNQLREVLDAWIQGGTP